MNLPEGYLLQVLQEQFGPVIGASPMALLSVIGRNMIGRIPVAPPGANLDEPAEPVDVAGLLQGDNSEEAFAELVHRHATSGVSGVVPKFLDGDAEAVGTGPHTKTTLFTHRHIIKGSSRHLPFASLNEPHPVRRPRQQRRGHRSRLLVNPVRTWLRVRSAGLAAVGAGLARDRAMPDASSRRQQAGLLQVGRCGRSRACPRPHDVPGRRQAVLLQATRAAGTGNARPVPPSGCNQRLTAGGFAGAKKKGSRSLASPFSLSGARSWTRTNDPLINSQVL